jgi:hypothetical protein
MLKDTEININKNNFTTKYWNDKGYTVNKEFVVKITDLPKNSNIRVKCLCDICGHEKEMKYQDYNKSDGLYGFYTCAKCSDVKKKKTCKSKNGTEHHLQVKEILDKQKLTNIDKYGCENVFQNNEIKEKIKEYYLENYGVDHYSKTEEYKDKYKQTMFEKYGVEHYTKTDEFRKYFSENNPMYNEKSILKLKETRILKKLQVPDSEKSDYKLYKTKVNNITRKNKRKLFENWNGNDHL